MLEFFLCYLREYRILFSEQTGLHGCHHINIPSRVIFPFGGNVFRSKHLKDGSLSSGMVSETIG